MERYDIAIIGTGPAGLEAAITAKVRNKKVLLIGQLGSSDKVSKAHTIQNYLGLPDISGSDLAKAYLDHLNKMEVEITNDKINAVYAMGSYFALQGHSADYEASSVILAAGLSVAKPFEGELDNLGRGVSYCATCDAALYKDKTAIVVSYDKEDEHEAEFLAERASKVYYLPMYEGCEISSSNIEIVENQKPVSISRKDDMMNLKTEDNELSADGIFILRQQVAPSQLVPGLKLNGNHVEVDRSMSTNLKGLFACGDITGAPYQYIKAAGEGNVAALSAVNYLNELTK